jgi:hypothetical protein
MPRHLRAIAAAVRAFSEAVVDDEVVIQTVPGSVGEARGDARSVPLLSAERQGLSRSPVVPPGPGEHAAIWAVMRLSRQRVDSVVPKPIADEQQSVRLTLVLVEIAPDGSEVQAPSCTSTR